MSDSYENPNPSVINEKLILDAVSVKDNKGADGKDPKKVDTEIDPKYKQRVVLHNDVKDIISLNLSFSNIKTIQNLQGLHSLRKLKLNSNLITEIKGLESLTKLEWLNLSFNEINKIENLSHLSNLTDLSIAHNKIEKLENLEGNMQLNVLCLAHNQLNKTQNCKSVIQYLYKFPNLQAISLKQNGYDEDDAYKFISYILEKIKYVDYKAARFDEKTAEVPQPVKTIREGIVGDDKEEKKKEEISPELKGMMEHFDHFRAALELKDEIKLERKNTDDPALFSNFDNMMQKQAEKWTIKVQGEIKQLYQSADLLRQVVHTQLQDSQSRVEQQNSDLVNKLKFEMKSLPKRGDPGVDFEAKYREFDDKVTQIEKELIENEVSLYDQIVPPDETSSDEKQYFSKYSAKSEEISDKLNKVCNDFQSNLAEILETVFNKENIQRVGGSSDKKSDEDRKAETYNKIKESAITEFQQKITDKTGQFAEKFTNFRNEKSDYYKERYKKNIDYIKEVCSNIRTKVKERRGD